MKNRLIIIHGLNNTTDAFQPLKQVFEESGYECLFITLPGHGKNRREARDLKSAFHHFDQSMKEVIKDPYSVLAFSHGALYLQLWLEKNQAPKPRSQVLLAPALFINYQARIEKLTSILPTFLFILSQTPKAFRRYRALYVWEYRTLLKGIKTYQSLTTPFKVPTMVIVDQQDELIDAGKLQKELELRNPQGFRFELLRRPFLKKKNLGKHHILFHPDYYSPDEWKNFIELVKGFFENQ